MRRIVESYLEEYGHKKIRLTIVALIFVCLWSNSLFKLIAIRFAPSFHLYFAIGYPLFFLFVFPFGMTNDVAEEFEKRTEPWHFFLFSLYTAVIIWYFFGFLYQIISISMGSWLNEPIFKTICIALALQYLVLAGIMVYQQGLIPGIVSSTGYILFLLTIPVLLIAGAVAKLFFLLDSPERSQEHPAK